MKLSHVVFIIAATAAAAGCSSIPDGEPPKGDIVRFEVTEKENYSARKAINLMTDSFSFAILGTMPVDSTIEIKANNQMAEKMAGDTVRYAADVIRLNIVRENGEYILRSNLSRNSSSILEWEMQCFPKAHQDQQIFSKKVSLTQ